MSVELTYEDPTSHYTGVEVDPTNSCAEVEDALLGQQMFVVGVSFDDTIEKSVRVLLRALLLFVQEISF